jgi:hypothetical protein
MPWIFLGVTAAIAIGAWVYLYPPNAQNILIRAGNVSQPSSPGSAYVLALPPGASWAPSPLPGYPSVSGSGSVIVRSTSNSGAYIVYGGNGGSLAMTWNDSTGTTQESQIAFSG